ncbi:MAG: response regulator containing a CheY-like receiver domain and an DNA-binding domain [Flavipsychrobacter sp.]|jgi:CheY-like chemotaxis protein|nr:response regulator containing a CheY-like receiver domain and an DNA-binding domain [Flavipsychrobacter sp.]
MSYFKDFVIIDDDIINNKLCRKIIEKTYPDVQITDFTNAREGLDFIIDKCTKNSDEKVIVLLDISMPIMNAWEFLDAFDTLPPELKSRVKVHILSSSINKNDMMRAQTNPNVEYYLIKPLTKESIMLIVNVLNKKMGLDTVE